MSLKRVAAGVAAAALATLGAVGPATPARAQVFEPGVLAFEQELLAQHYDPGPVDGYYDADTQHAVFAFQKVNSMARTGERTADVVAAVFSRPPTPTTFVPGGGSTRVEIDLGRQVLFLYENDALLKILPVSTGNDERFCTGRRCRFAVTPGGAFRVYKQVRGWQTGPLGSLFNPSYFNGGIAIHGSRSVPPYPASHGCIRIPMSAAGWLPARIPPGTPVYVFGNDYPPPAPLFG